MAWIWDPKKDEANRRKHGLPLSVGRAALDDPLAVSVPDPHPDGDRWNTLASISGVTLFIVHTLPDDDAPGRIISVRRADRTERKAYKHGEH
ncbi:MAG: BrnT family toxin [Azospirillaceae bacterium]|nr:BrnT family toxin [Azospirillaceae bacterium]